MADRGEQVRCPLAVRADGMDNLPSVDEMQDEFDFALYQMWKKSQECDARHRHGEDPRASTHCVKGDSER
jgi:hypothetical protein